MTSGLVLANNILRRAFEEGIVVDLLKLQKLLYFTALDYLYRYGLDLFSEQFLRKARGPVLQSVFDEFSGYGTSKIVTFARDSFGRVVVVNEEKEVNIKTSIDYIWNKYKYKTGSELSDISHEEGSAWKMADPKVRYIITRKDMEDEIENRKTNGSMI